MQLQILPRLALLLAVTTAATPSPRNTRLAELLKWANEGDIEMHPNLEWKSYGDNDFGFQLTKPMPRGTVLMTIPRSLVLDATILQTEAEAEYDKTQLETSLTRLGDFAIHKEGFFIFLQLLKCRQQAQASVATNDTQQSRWIPWVKAMPKTFTTFTKAEQECLPFYAKYATEYQDQKFQAFVNAAVALGVCAESTESCILSSNNNKQITDAQWAFLAVGSRFWKTAPTLPGDLATSELVPIGDMFNHREPHNVGIIHDPKTKAVQFVYYGGTEGSKDLFITYGQPSNPHRFLAIFGFVPTDMEEVWCHLAYSNNPYSEDASQMVINTESGVISQPVWDAVLYELAQPESDAASQEAFRATLAEKSIKYKKITSGVLMNHIDKQLDELTMLRQKIDAYLGSSPNRDMILAHNEFLAGVFQRAKKNLSSGR